MLCEIGVLIFVDKHVTEIVLKIFQYIGVIAQKDICIIKQVIEVHRVGNVATVAVCLVYIDSPRAFGGSVRLHQRLVKSIIFRRIQSVLCHGYIAKNSSRPIELFIKPHILYYCPYKRL